MLNETLLQWQVLSSLRVRSDAVECDSVRKLSVAVPGELMSVAEAVERVGVCTPLEAVCACWLDML